MQFWLTLSEDFLHPIWLAFLENFWCYSKKFSGKASHKKLKLRSEFFVRFRSCLFEKCKNISQRRVSWTNTPHECEKNDVNILKDFYSLPWYNWFFRMDYIRIVFAWCLDDLISKLMNICIFDWDLHQEVEEFCEACKETNPRSYIFWSFEDITKSFPIKKVTELDYDRIVKILYLKIHHKLNTLVKAEGNTFWVRDCIIHLQSKKSPKITITETHN